MFYFCRPRGLGGSSGLPLRPTVGRVIGPAQDGAVLSTPAAGDGAAKAISETPSEGSAGDGQRGRAPDLESRRTPLQGLYLGGLEPQGLNPLGSPSQDPSQGPSQGGVHPSKKTHPSQDPSQDPSQGPSHGLFQVPTPRPQGLSSQLTAQRVDGPPLGGRLNITGVVYGKWEFKPEVVGGFLNLGKRGMESWLHAVKRSYSDGLQPEGPTK